ncbi:MAG: hypothetical protein J6W11_00395 [Alphaproteobacteria bacterium]|nr:hypothetical protein [Alphaproteobacteria bacterium]
MLNEDEIFQTYVVKRLANDHNLGMREYLDSSEYDLAESDSLKYLSEQSGIELLPVEEKWIKEPDGRNEDEDNKRYSGDDKPELIPAIKTRDIIASRAENIARIVQAFPPALAQKIIAFEQSTQYFYAPGYTKSERLAVDIETALSLVQDNRTLQQLVIKHRDRLFVPLSRSEQNKARKQATDDKKKLDFHDLAIKTIHTSDMKQKAVLLNEMLQNMAYKNPNDICEFFHIDATQYANRSSAWHARITSEMTYNIYKELDTIYKKIGYPNKATKEKIEKYTFNYNKYHVTPKLLGPNGAFKQGGIFGPDSKLALQNIESAPKDVTLPAQKEERITANNKNIKPEVYIQKKIDFGNGY